MYFEKKSAFKKIWNILVIALVCLLMFSIITSQRSAPTLSRYGSSGDEVRQIQEALANKGYDPGKIDGIYGNKTLAAVKAFQRDYGLTADGIAGKNTLKALGISSSSGGYSNFSESEFNLLASIISAEARGEPYEGQVAVGAVIMNRISHPDFPDTLSGVIYQPGAFSCLYDGGINAAVADSAYKAAKDAINGSDPTGGAIYYYNPKKTSNAFMHSRPVVAVIGEHRFCV